MSNHLMAFDRNAVYLIDGNSFFDCQPNPFLCRTNSLGFQ